MRTAAARLALAGTLGLTALAGGVVLGPALAGAAPALTQTATPEETETAPSADRTARLREHLQALVDAGTLDAAQADAVAGHLAAQLPARGGHGPGGHGGHGGRGGHVALDVAAETLGVTEDELRTALQGGSSLADVAEAEGVELDALVTALVEAARERLAQAVTDGRLTQEQADEKAADLQARVEEHVQREGLGRRGPRPEAPAEEGTVEPSSLGTA